jgi:hypothetical protein
MGRRRRNETEEQRARRELMSGTSGTGRNGKKHSYYICNNRKKHKCDKQNVIKDIIEELVVEKCRELLSDEVINKMIGLFLAKSDQEYAKSETARLEKKSIELDKQINNLTMSIAICTAASRRRQLRAPPYVRR